MGVASPEGRNIKDGRNAHQKRREHVRYITQWHCIRQHREHSTSPGQTDPPFPPHTTMTTTHQ